MRKFTLPTYLVLFLIAAAVLWYFGDHRPTQKALKAAPKKVYEPMDRTTQDPSTVEQQATGAMTHAQQREHLSEAENPSISPMTHENGQIDTPDEVADIRTAVPNAQNSSEVSNGSTAAPVAPAEEHCHHPEHSMEEITSEQAEFDALMAEVLTSREETAALQERAQRTREKRMPELVRMLKAKSPAEQRDLLARAKQLALNELTRNPIFADVLPDLANQPEVSELIWNTVLDQLAEYGYTPPVVAETE